MKRGVRMSVRHPHPSGYCCPSGQIGVILKGLYVKTEQDNVAILHDVFFAFRAYQTFFFGSGN